MAQNKVTTVETKKENGLVAFYKKHQKGIKLGLTIAGCVTAGFGAGYLVCSAVHHEPNDTVEKIDNAIDNLCTPENVEQIEQVVNTPEIEQVELDIVQNPEV
jgi:hypothetical protein